MAFVKLNQLELSALHGLLPIQICLYVLAIKPFIDFQTGLVGVNRKISWQSIREALYVEPKRGVVGTGSPSKAQLRRAVCQLEKVGLIRYHLNNECLIFECILADTNNSAQNKVVPFAIPQEVPFPKRKNKKESIGPAETKEKAGPLKLVKAVPPLREYIKEKTISNTNVLDISKKKRNFATQLPNDFVITEAIVTTALKNNWPHPEEEIEAFRDYHLARGTVFKDWTRAFYTWLRNAKRFNQPRRQSTSFREQAILNTLATCVNQGGVIYEQQ